MFLFYKRPSVYTGKWGHYSLLSMVLKIRPKKIQIGTVKFKETEGITIILKF